MQIKVFKWPRMMVMIWLLNFLFSFSTSGLVFSLNIWIMITLMRVNYFDNISTNNKIN